MPQSWIPFSRTMASVRPANSFMKLIFLLAILLLDITPGILAEERPSTAQTDHKAPLPFTVAVTGSGPPMILIPGLACGGSVWDDTVNHFKDRYECHVVSMAGFAGQPAIRGPFLQPAHDGLIRYIRERKLERPVLIGHSLGAFLAFWLGADLPDQVGPIIAVDGVPFFPALREPNTTAELQKGTAAYLSKNLKRMAPAQFAIYNRMTLTGMITRSGDLEEVAASSGQSDPTSVGQALYELLTTDLRERGKDIRSPYLLLAAAPLSPNPLERSRVEEGYAAQVAQVPNHKVVFAPRARHFIQLDDPVFFYQEVEDFLKEVKSNKRGE